MLFASAAPSLQGQSRRATLAAAQQANLCETMASLNWYDTNTTEVSQETWYRAVRFYHDDVSSSYSQHKSSGFDAVVPLDGVLLAAGFKQDATGYGSFKRSTTDYSSSEYYDKFKETTYSKTGSAKAAAVLQTCLKERGVDAVLLNVDDSNEFALAFSYDRVSPGIPSVKVRLGYRAGITCERQKLVVSIDVPSPALLCERTDSLPTTRAISLNAEGKGIIIENVLFVPPVRREVAFKGCPDESFEFSVVDGPQNSSGIKTFCEQRFAFHAIDAEPDGTGQRCWIDIVDLSTGQTAHPFPILTTAEAFPAATTAHVEALRATVDLEVRNAVPIWGVCNLWASIRKDP